MDPDGIHRPPVRDMMEEVEVCELCEEPIRVPHRVRGMDLLPIIQCSNCGLAITSPRFTRSYISECYPDDCYAHVAREDGAVRRLVNKLKAYKGGYPTKDGVFIRGFYKCAAALFGNFFLSDLQYLGEGRRLLDVGCGIGAGLQWAKAHGWDVYGLEMDEAAVENARAAGLTQVACGDLDTAQYPDGYFDAITMIQVLEHIHSPTAALRRRRALLKAGGFLQVAVPNFDSHFRVVMNDWWPSHEIPRHLYHFSEPTLCKLAEKYGLAVERVKYRSRLITTVSNLRSLKKGLSTIMETSSCRKYAVVLKKMGANVPGAVLSSHLRLSDNMLLTFRRVE